MIFINHTDMLDGKIVLVEIRGPLNGQTSTDFEQYIEQLLEKGQCFIILDTHELEHVSSAGIGVTLFIQKKIAAHNGFLVLCNLPEEIITLYRLIGFDRIFTIAESTDEALKIMDKQLQIRMSPRDTEPGSVVEEGDTPVMEEAASPADEAVFENPLIVECADCKGLIRVKGSGHYLCPDCKAEFTVERDQTIVF